MGALISGHCNVVLVTSSDVMEYLQDVQIELTMRVNRVFHILYKVDRNGNFVFKGFNNSKKKIIAGLGVQFLTI